MIPVSIPSPPLDWGILFQIGPFPIRSYALALLLGMVAGVWVARKRWIARGGDVAAVEEIVVWAIPFGILGARIYHVISTPGPYFGEGGNWVKIFAINEGGLGIWGAVALGALGAYIGAKRAGVSFPAFIDAAAPGILLAQAIGRLGNYFNQELFGGATTLPWGLQIDAAAPSFPRDLPVDTLFHPTFLYELLWNVVGVFVVLYLDRRLKLRNGRVFWLYVIVYTTGRVWIENVRIDTAVHIGGLRINVWVSIVVLLGSIFAFWLVGKRNAGTFEEFPARVTKGKVAVATKRSASTKKPASKKTPAKKTPAKSAPAKKAVSKTVARKESPGTKATTPKK